jgi:hypothetical protein
VLRSTRWPAPHRKQKFTTATTDDLTILLKLLFIIDTVNSTLTIKISIPPVVEKTTTNGKRSLPDEDYIPLIEKPSC